MKLNKEKIHPTRLATLYVMTERENIVEELNVVQGCAIYDYNFIACDDESSII